jgi:hypothetical protein
MKDLDVLTDGVEDVLAQHGPHAKTQPMVQAQRRAVEHLPKENKRLAFVVTGYIDIAVVFRFKRDISRIERQLQNGALFRGGTGAWEIQTPQDIAYDLGTP